MAELNPNAQKWVDALRSGKYKQGKLALTEIFFDGQEFDCCLGVACKVAVENGLELEIYDKMKNVGYMDKPKIKYIRFYDASYGTLPRPVMEWLGLRTADGRYTADEAVHQLTQDNDNGKTFEEIASIVESKPQGLFREGV